MSEVSVGWSFVLDFTNCITLFSLVSFLLVIICHLYHMLVYDFIEKKKNKISWIQLISRNVVFKGFGRVLKRSPYCTLHKKWSFALKISAKNVTKSTVSADLVTFTEEILNWKLDFWCSANRFNWKKNHHRFFY